VVSIASERSGADVRRSATSDPERRRSEDTGTARRRPRLRWSPRGFALTVPAIALVFGIVYAGVLYTGYTSTLDWDGISPTPEQVGAGNYREMLGDDVFWATLRHLVVFFLLTIPAQMLLGFLIALLLQTRVRGAVLVKACVFVPVVLAPAVVGTAFRQLLAADGAFNTALEAIGLGSLAHPWLADPATALYAVAAINVWQWTGFSFLLYQAALSQIDDSLLEAARLDGAGVFRSIVSIIAPLLRGTHLTLLVVGCIGSLKTFDLVYVLTGGGPSRSTELLTTYVYSRTVSQFDVGYSAALTMVLLLFSVVLTAAQSRISDQKR
jgi:raffinose/stachyose/melibiose transport system permease protein